MIFTKTNKIIFILLTIALVVVVIARFMVTDDVASPEVEEVVTEYKDMIRIDSPLPKSTVNSPLIITGEARGGWFFEASFPVLLVNWDGLIIGEGFATAEGDWMTEEYVPFKATITYTVDTSVSSAGSIILQKQNASGLPENDDAFEYPIVFANSNTNEPASETDDSALIGTSWQWTHTILLNGDRVTPPGSDFVLSFDGAGKVSSATDCNTLTGTAVTQGEVISFGSFVSTKMFCEGSLETVYASQLGLANSYAIDREVLKMQLNRDYGTMYFTKN